jgi:hypothetical protein
LSGNLENNIDPRPVDRHLDQLAEQVGLRAEAVVEAALLKVLDDPGVDFTKPFRPKFTDTF